MLLSDASYYTAPVLTLVAGVLGGWMLRYRLGRPVPGRTRSVPRYRAFGRRRGDNPGQDVPAGASAGHLAAAQHVITGKAAPCVRNTFALALDRCLPEAARRGDSLSVVLVSIDNARNLSDGGALRIGNETLDAVGKAFIAAVRATDWVARFDATTFALLLPGAAGANTLIVVERLRRAVSRVAADGLAPLPLTLSIGTTDFVPGDSSATVLDRAEEAMFAAIAAGGDCVRTQCAPNACCAAS